MSAIESLCRELSTECFRLPKINGVCGIPGIKRRARQISFVAAESTIYTYLMIQRKLFILTVRSACVVNIVVIIWIIGLIQLKNVLKHRLLPGATRSLETAGSCLVPPTQQPSRSPAKERSSQPNSASDDFQSYPLGDGK